MPTNLRYSIRGTRKFEIDIRILSKFPFKIIRKCLSDYFDLYQTHILLINSGIGFFDLKIFGFSEIQRLNIIRNKEL